MYPTWYLAIFIPGNVLKHLSIRGGSSVGQSNASANSCACSTGFSTNPQGLKAVPL